MADSSPARRIRPWREAQQRCPVTVQCHNVIKRNPAFCPTSRNDPSSSASEGGPRHRLAQTIRSSHVLVVHQKTSQETRNGFNSDHRHGHRAGAYRVLAGIELRSPDPLPHGGLGRPRAGIRRDSRARARSPPWSGTSAGSVRHDPRLVRIRARRERVGDSRLARAVILGTIPAGIAGLLFKGFIEEQMRSPLVIARATIGFGLLLWWSDVVSRRTPQPRDEHSLSWKDILLIGCAQALALIPGTSRSGVTMTAGLLLGLSRSGAALLVSAVDPDHRACQRRARFDLVEGEVAVDWTAMGLGWCCRRSAPPVHPLFPQTAGACRHVAVRDLSPDSRRRAAGTVQRRLVITPRLALSACRGVWPIVLRRPSLVADRSAAGRARTPPDAHWGTSFRQTPRRDRPWIRPAAPEFWPPPEGVAIR